jgi:GT2 family glycosyltransferase
MRDGLRRILTNKNREAPTQYKGLHQGYICWVDEPLNWRGVTRRFRLAGWCFSKNSEAIEGLRACIGDHQFAVRDGLSRPDVARIHPDQEGARQSGFEVMVEAPSGAIHDLRFEARHSEGLWREIFSQRIVVSRKAGGSYGDWIRNYDTLRWGDRSRIRKQIRSFRLKPRFSVLLPVSSSTVDYLREAIESVRAQFYPDWQLLLLPDAALPDETCRILNWLAGRDSRIQVRDRSKEKGVDSALEEALALSDGDYIFFLGSQDKLAPTALYFVLHAVNDDPKARLIYTDEDTLDSAGLRINPHFKPDWNWQLLLGRNYVSDLCVYRADLIKSLDFSARFEGPYLYDLLLRCAEKITPGQTRHIPRVLYHRRAPLGTLGPESAARTVQEHLKRQGIAAEVTLQVNKNYRRVRYVIPGVRPTVSIIIPTRDMSQLLRPCLESILEKTAYSPFEIIVVDNGSRDAATLNYLAEVSVDSRVHLLRLDEEFNYSRLVNLGVQNTKAEFVALLNNDVMVINPEWLEEMVSQVLQPGIGAVGPRLLYPDGRIQQAGVILGAGLHGVAEVAHRGLPKDDEGYFGRAALAQELSAVGAACMLVRRGVYLEVGGFDEENLKIAFNDIDFCLKLLQRGARIVYTPYAELYHHEHASRGSEYTAANEQRFTREIEFMKEKWKETLLTDRNYNPNLSLGRELFAPAFPPRVTKPWQPT